MATASGRRDSPDCRLRPRLRTSHGSRLPSTIHWNRIFIGRDTRIQWRESEGSLNPGMRSFPSISDRFGMHARRQSCFLVGGHRCGGSGRGVAVGRRGLFGRAADRGSAASRRRRGSASRRDRDPSCSRLEDLLAVPGRLGRAAAIRLYRLAEREGRARALSGAAAVPRSGRHLDRLQGPRGVSARDRGAGSRQARRPAPGDRYAVCEKLCVPAQGKAELALGQTAACTPMH